MAHRRYAVLTAAFVVASLAGCGAAVDKAAVEVAERELDAEHGGEIEIDPGGEGVSASGIDDDGRRHHYSMGPGARLPEGFPTNLPVPDQSQLRMAAQRGKDYTVTLLCDQSATAVFSFYRQGLEQQGWTVKAAISNTERSILTAETAAGDTVTVSVLPSAVGGRVEVQIMLTVAWAVG